MNKNNNNLSGNNKTGFTKEFYENISNNKLLGITFTKELYYTYKNNNKQKKEINEFIKTNSDVRRHLENKRAFNLKNEQENFFFFIIIFSDSIIFNYFKIYTNITLNK